MALMFQIGAFGIDERSEIDFDSPVEFRNRSAGYVSMLEVVTVASGPVKSNNYY